MLKLRQQYNHCRHFKFSPQINLESENEWSTMYSLSDTLTHENNWIDMVLASSGTDTQGSHSSIRYAVSAIENGILLSIWEIAVPTTSRPASYLYKLNYRLESETEVQEILDWYLQGFAQVNPETFPYD